MATDWSETSLSPTEVCEWGRKRKKTRKLVMVKEGDEERKQARRSSKLRATSKKSYQKEDINKDIRRGAGWLVGKEQRREELSNCNWQRG